MFKKPTMIVVGFLFAFKFSLKNEESPLKSCELELLIVTQQRAFFGGLVGDVLKSDEF